MQKILTFIKQISVLRVSFALILGYAALYIYTHDSIPYLSNLDLIFHEAGHFVFIIFGETAHVLGGTLMQILLPGIFMLYFFYRGEYYSSAVLLWWLGENLTNISIYMADANTRALPLLGDGDHDWFTFFGMYDLLPYAALLGAITWYIGLALMVFSVLWALKHSIKPKHLGMFI